MRKRTDTAWRGRLLPGAIGLCFVIACGGGGGGGSGTEPTASSLTASGWSSFEAGAFGEAIADFEGAVALDSLYEEAYIGLGWSRSAADSLAAALTAFRDALSISTGGADLYAGRAVALRDVSPPDYESAAAAADSALALEPRYLFAHDDSFDWRDLHLIVAHCRFALAEYDEANARVDSLGGNRADPASDRFIEALMAEIDRLSAELID